MTPQAAWSRHRWDKAMFKMRFHPVTTLLTEPVDPARPQMQRSSPPCAGIHTASNQQQNVEKARE